MLHILGALARAELTDGLSLAQLLAEPSCRLRHDATVVVILSQVNEETAIALGSLAAAAMPSRRS